MTRAILLDRGGLFHVFRAFYITAMGRSYSELSLPTTKLEILPAFTGYFI